MTRPFDPTNKQARYVMTPDGIGTLRYQDPTTGEVAVLMGKPDGKHVRGMRWFDMDEIQEVEE